LSWTNVLDIAYTWQILQAKDAERAEFASERSEWEELRYSLERKVEEAEDLNSSLRSEINKLRTENADMEQDLRAQIAQLKVELDSRPQQQHHTSDDTEWKQRCEELERELNEQQHIAEEVRKDAAQFLEEMKELSARSDMALEKEERLNNQVSGLQAELKEWKARYARTKTQLRSLKASSVGLASLASPDAANYARDLNFTTPEGLVKDVHVTKFQLSIDELLQVARRPDPEQVLESMKHVVKCVRAITGDIDSTPLSQMQSPSSSINGDGNLPPEKQQAKLKARVSATANNLITASKNHASSAGLSPVSLLDAAASHLSTSVIELVKHVKVRPTSEEELHREEDDRHTPLSNKSSYSPYLPYANGTNGNNGLGLGLGHLRHRSRGGSSDSAAYSHLSSSYGGRRSDILNSISIEKDTGMTEFKVRCHALFF
jgi:predicted  nucleic acid-binding Zn-ribbon protein